MEEHRQRAKELMEEVLENSLVFTLCNGYTMRMNTLPAIDFSDNPTDCCPRFNPEPWDKREFTFEDLHFVKAVTRSLFYMPLNMNSVMPKIQGAIARAKASPKDKYFMLSKDLSPWKSEHYLLVESEVPGYPRQTITGTWYSQVFEGPFHNMGIWMKEFNEELKFLNTAALDYAAFYTTCPNCVRTYGKNYVVLFGKIRE